MYKRLFIYTLTYNQIKPIKYPDLQFFKFPALAIFTIIKRYNCYFIIAPIKSFQLKKFFWQIAHFLCNFIS